MRRCAAFLVFLWCIACASQSLSPVSITIVESGEYAGDDSLRNFDVAAGTLQVRRTGTPPKLRFLRETNTIPAQLGVAFGVRFKVESASAQPVELTIRWKHPRIANAVSGRASDVETARLSAKPGAAVPAVFQFDFPWEVQPGSWVVEVSDGARVLAARDFTVVAQPLH
jgi:hypothetical protein